MKKVIIYTDASVNKTKCGKDVAAWGFIVDPKSELKVTKTFADFNQTINRAEATAVLEALKYAKHVNKEDHSKGIELYCDSKLTVDSINVYMDSWRRKAKNGTWIKSNGEKVVNQDVFKEIFELKKQFKNLKIIHVKAHDVSEFNNEIDLVVGKEVEKFCENNNLILKRER